MFNFLDGLVNWVFDSFHELFGPSFNGITFKFDLCVEF
jgi:hypothetical protein